MEELVKSLRQCAEASCAGCKNDLVKIGCRGMLQREVADAIENISKAYQMMAEAYEAEVTKPRWIPVTERLPELHKEVLACNVEYGLSGLGFVMVAVWDGTDWIETWEKSAAIHYITHWMPLPKPPKEETE